MPSMELISLNLILIFEISFIKPKLNKSITNLSSISFISFIFLSDNKD